MKLIFLLGICVSLAASFTASAETTNGAAGMVVANPCAIPTLRTNRLEDTHRKFERYSGKHFDIVFDGDSIMNRWETTGKEIWNQRYAGTSADFGIEGDRVENVLWRLQQGQVNKVDPKVVVLMIGTNNSGRNSADQIAGGIKVLVAEYEKLCPNAHIILMGIFPRGEKSADAGRRKVAAVNREIKALGAEERVTYIDIGLQLVESDGTISRDMMPDFLHPTAKGYKIWAAAIQPVIDQYVR
jgi:lysophospholipase L1-like esterase